MWYNDKIKEIGDFTSYINKKYCDKWNIDLVVDNTRRVGKKHPTYEKPPLLRLKMEEDYDYVGWIDTDAIFYDFETDIRDWINPDKILTAMEEPQRVIEDTYYQVNAGFVLWKNNDRGKKLVEMWHDSKEVETLRIYTISHKDQGRLADMILKNIIREDERNFFPYGKLQKFRLGKDIRNYRDINPHKPQIYHFAANGKYDNRLKNLKKLASEIQEYL